MRCIRVRAMAGGAGGRLLLVMGVGMWEGGGRVDEGRARRRGGFVRSMSVAIVAVVWRQRIRVEGRACVIGTIDSGGMGAVEGLV